MSAAQFTVEPGRPLPLGATVTGKGVNFSLFSRHATKVELLIFQLHDDLDPIAVFELDPLHNRSFFIWHIHISPLSAGVHYAYRVDGPSDPGNRFDSQKVLLDPYSRGIAKKLWNRSKACASGDNLHCSMRNVVIDAHNYDWEGVKCPRYKMENSVIYELHVGGFTKHPSSGVKHPGTYAGVIEKIPYLKELGITAVELLPVFDFDENEIERTGPDGRLLKNYWGYSPVSFFAPHRSYCVFPQTGNHMREFRDMVKAFHRAGIEVILDVVFNHTSEGSLDGPTINFRGIDNRSYYHLDSENPDLYKDYSGCGNTLQGNHPLVAKFISDCLEFWVKEMHVNGFRFDEASVLTRDENGNPMRYPPALWNLEMNDSLMNTKLIAEAWDAAGLYQVGHFPGFRWAEWNGRYRDDVRRFVRGDASMIRSVASRIAGSADLYQKEGRYPINSINFITCHDGFTLNDLVSYNQKHNKANGEENRDGMDENHSWNCGEEGETNDPAIEKLRKQQIRNLFSILMLSRGVPMITAGDEVRRTQKGNNNAYCQDNEISWIDWSFLDRNADQLRFFKNMIRFRKVNRILCQPYYYTGNKVNKRGLPDITWHGCKLNQPGWDDENARALAFTLGGIQDDPDIHVMMNMYSLPLVFDLPISPNRIWRRLADTSLDSPDDATDHGHEVAIQGESYIVNSFSIVILVS
jgi:glycogen operon protein